MSDSESGQTVKSFTVMSLRSPVLLLDARKVLGLSTPEDERAREAILFSALAVEAFLNDLQAFLHHSGTLVEPLPMLRAALKELEDEHASIRLKVYVACFILTSKSPDFGGRPLQSFQLLIKIRNRLAHPRPSVLPNGQLPASDLKFLRELAAVGLNEVPSEDPRRHGDWEAPLWRLATGQWALRTAEDTIRMIVMRLPKEFWRDSLLKSLRL